MAGWVYTHGRSGSKMEIPAEKHSDLIAALDASIAHCEEWRDEFWMRTATLLRDLRAVAAAMPVCEEERVSHAVA